MIKIILNIAIVAAILLSSGCVNVRHDVSRRRNAWGVYREKTTYALRQDVFLIRLEDGLEPSRLALVPPSTANRGSGFYSSPHSIAGYVKAPAASAQASYGRFTAIDQVEGIVSRGTEFIPHSVKRNSGWDVWFGNHTDDTVYGEIVTGKFKGAIADLSDISWCMEDKGAPNQYVKRQKNAREPARTGASW